MKKFIICLAVVMFLGAGAVMLSGGESHQHGLKHYVAAQEALAADNFTGAKTALLEFAKANAKANGTAIEKLALKAAAASDIKTMRKAFKPLSEEVAAHGAPDGFGVAFCPMADSNTGGYWVQKKGKIANPYFGSSMLRCGAFKKYEGKKHSHAHPHSHKH